MNLSSAIRTTKSVITANSPVLLVGAAVAGVVTTGIFAAKAGYKARGIVDTAQEEKGEEPLTTQEMAKLTWLCYAVPAVTGASTIASVVGVHAIHTKRHAALAGLYAVGMNKLDDYREKAEEMLGTKKTQDLNNALGQKAVDRDPVENHEVLILSDGGELMYDEWSGRYFLGSTAIVERAVSNINIQLVESGNANLNEYYDHIGLDPIPMGDQFGWSGMKIDPKFGATKTKDGRSAVSVWFHEVPKMDQGLR